MSHSKDQFKAWVARAKELLERVQWNGNRDWANEWVKQVCPSCGGSSPSHNDSCALRALLRDAP